MGEQMNFTVEQREDTGKGANRRLRQQGRTPGIVYGKQDPLKVSMRADSAIRFIKSMKGAKTVFELDVKTGENTETKKVILQDYQLSPWGEKLIHADFMEVTDQTQLSIEVPVRVLNEEECPAVKTGGGVIQVIRWTIPIKCKVKDIPEAIELDLIDLEFGDSIHVLDIDYPEGVKPVVYGRNFTILTTVGRPAEEEEEELEAVEGEEEVTEEGAEEQTEEADAEE